MAGKFLTAAARRGGAEILPVDSEHSAVFQVHRANRREDILRVILTASGGPVPLPHRRGDAVRHGSGGAGAPRMADGSEDLRGLRDADEQGAGGDRGHLALRPPRFDRIDVLIHPQSVIHSMVEFRDGSVLAQMGIPDMRIPIGYALSYPERLPMELPRLRPHRMEGWGFESPDRKRFPALSLAYARRGNRRHGARGAERRQRGSGQGVPVPTGSGSPTSCASSTA